MVGLLSMNWPSGRAASRFVRGGGRWRCQPRRGADEIARLGGQATRDRTAGLEARRVQLDTAVAEQTEGRELPGDGIDQADEPERLERVQRVVTRLEQLDRHRHVREQVHAVVALRDQPDGGVGQEAVLAGAAV